MRSDVIILGLGAMGAAAAWALARRGLRVLGLEQYGIGHAWGSSHGRTRLIRMCYYEHPDYVPLLRRTYVLWREMEAESGRPILHVTGGLFAGPGESEFVRGTKAAAAAHGLPLEALSRGEASRRWPQVVIPESHEALFEPAAGYLCSDAAVACMAALARRRGATLLEHERAVEWSAHARGVRVRTERGEHEAGTLVIAAGPWVAALLPGLGVTLRVTRQVVAWFAPRDEAAASPHRLPVWAMLDDEGVLNYGMPNLPAGTGGPGLNAGRHVPGQEATPGPGVRAAEGADTASIRAFLEHRIPAAAGPMLDAATCLYTGTPDGHFILDRHPRHERVLVLSPCSGHGFKFAPVVGEVAADLATRGDTPLPIGFLRLARFGGT